MLLRRWLIEILPSGISLIIKNLIEDNFKKNDIIIIISLTSIFTQEQSRVWTAASQLHYSRQSTLTTYWDLLFSHSDACISRKSCLVGISKAAVYSWGCWSEFLVANTLPHTNKLGLGKRRWNLETSSAVFEFSVPYTDKINVILCCNIHK